MITIDSLKIKCDIIKVDVEGAEPLVFYGAKKTIKCQLNYAQHIPESEVYYSLAKQIGIKTPMEDCEINNNGE